jgi:hypothetical protein
MRSKRKDNVIKIKDGMYAIPKKDPGLASTFVPVWRERLDVIIRLTIAWIFLWVLKLIRNHIPENLALLNDSLRIVGLLLAGLLVFFPSVVERFFANLKEQRMRTETEFGEARAPVKLVSRSFDFPAISDRGSIEVRDGAIFFTGEIFDCVLVPSSFDSVVRLSDYEVSIHLKPAGLYDGQTINLSSVHPIDLRGTSIGQIGDLLKEQPKSYITPIRPPLVLYPWLSPAQVWVHYSRGPVSTVALVFAGIFAIIASDGPILGDIWLVIGIIGVASVVSLINGGRDRRERNRARNLGIPENLVLPIREVEEAATINELKA